jgi:hypothetical protein
LAEKEMIRFDVNFPNIEILAPNNPLTIWTRDNGPFSDNENVSNYNFLAVQQEYEKNGNINPWYTAPFADGVVPSQHSQPCIEQIEFHT